MKMLFPEQKVIDKLSELSYKGIYVYRYILDVLRISDMYSYSQNGFDKTDLADLSEMDEKLSEGYFVSQEYMNEVIRKGLPKRDVLFVLSYTREYKNGERINVLMDRYIDLLDPEQYLVLERYICDGRDEDIPYHSKNLVHYEDMCVMSYYGIDQVDYEDLSSFINSVFLSAVEEYYGSELPSVYKNFLIAKLYLKLQYRRAFIEFYKEVISRVSPKMIVYSHGAMDMMCFLYEAAAELGVPCYEVRHGIDNRYVFIPESIRFQDYLLEYSDLTMPLFHEKERKRHIAIGKPGYANNSIEWSGDTAGGGRMIVGIVSSGEGDLLDVAIYLAGRMDPNRYIIAFKYHPSEPVNEDLKQELAQKYRNLLLVGAELNIETFFAKCEMVIGERSTAVFEALIYNRIKLIVFDGSDMIQPEIIRRLRDNEELVIASSVEDVAREIETYQRGVDYRPRGEIFWIQNPEDRFRKLVETVCI